MFVSISLDELAVWLSARSCSHLIINKLPLTVSGNAVMLHSQLISQWLMRGGLIVVCVR